MKTTISNLIPRFLRSASWKAIVAFILAAGLLLSIDSPSLLTGPPRRAGRVVEDSTGRGEGVVAQASTEVGGPIDTDTTWTLAGSPYIVTSSIAVSVGVTLTIEAGVTVKFGNGKRLLVEGTLIARGTAEQPITLTSNRPSPGDWGNITFAATSPSATYDGDTYTGGSILQYAIVEYGGYYENGAVSAEGSAPYLDHNIIRYNATSGIYADTSGTRITNNTVYNNSASNSGGGIRASNSTISGNTVYNNSAFYYYSGGGIYASNSTISGNTVYSNWATWSGGIGAFNNSTISGNTVYSNWAAWGGGISSSNSTVSGNIVYSNSTSYYGGGIYAVSSTVICNTVVNNSSSAPVSGGLQISGQPQVISNTLYANSPYDLVNDNSYRDTPLDATNNYWGTIVSAEIAAHIYDFTDDSSRQRVEYSPFLSAPDPCAPPAPGQPTPTPTPTATPVPPTATATTTATLTPMLTPTPTGTPTPGIAIPINAGWTNIGAFWPNGTYTASSMAQSMISQGIQVQEIARWYGGTWESYLVEFPVIDFPIERGWGYFVRSTNSGTWIAPGP